MSDLLTTLDRIADDMSKDFPDMSEAEVALAVIRLNLTVLVTTLTQLGMNGEDLSNEALYGICMGLVDTCQWMLAKELVDHTMPLIENELRDEAK